MKKIPSLFKRDYEGTRLVYDEVVPGSEWVLEGVGVPTEKYDGTACMVRDGVLYKRYDRKPNRRARRRHRSGEAWPLSAFKSAPDGWMPCEDAANLYTGHWPGWLPVGDGPEDKWHREAGPNWFLKIEDTYELVGPKIQGNPYGLKKHELWRHGEALGPVPRDYEGLKKWFGENPDVEGVVWWLFDGRKVKVKQKDFGYKWPQEIVIAKADR